MNDMECRYHLHELPEFEYAGRRHLCPRCVRDTYGCYFCRLCQSKLRARLCLRLSPGEIELLIEKTKAEYAIQVDAPIMGMKNIAHSEGLESQAALHLHTGPYLGVRW